MASFHSQQGCPTGTVHGHIPDLQRLAGKVGESGDGSPQHSPGAFPSGDITREAKQFLQADSQF